MKCFFVSRQVALAALTICGFGAVGAAEAQSSNSPPVVHSHRGYGGPYGLLPGYGVPSRIVVRQSVTMIEAPRAPADGYGVVAATGIRAAPIGAPALYVIEPAPGMRARRESRRERLMNQSEFRRFGERDRVSSRPRLEADQAAEIDRGPAISTVRAPRG